MIHSKRLLRRPISFRRLTGVSPEEFTKLAGELAVAWEASRTRQAAARPRQRKPGGGPKFAHDLTDRLLSVLIYYRTYISQEFLGVLFDVNASTVCRTLQELNPLLASIFRIPEKRITLAEDEMEELFFDGTEQPVERPQRKQRAYYSGKKKRHTMKHQVVVTRVRKESGTQPQKVRIKAVSRSYPGKVHDKRMYERCRMVPPPGIPGVGDSGYQGSGLITPRKRPRGGALTPSQKAANRALSKRRIVVEHGIGKMKIWKAAAERFRNDRKRRTVMIKNIAGLHNRMFG
jgi:transposase